MARVFVGATLAVMVGAGPAVAWDMTTQMPRPPAVSVWSRTPSPWKRAGRDLKDAFKAVASVYLPRTHRVPAEPQLSGAPAPAASSVASVVRPVKPVPRPIPTFQLDLIE